MSKLQQIVTTEMNENGVQNVTVGHIISRQIARQSVDLLRMEGGEAYKEYKAIKFNCEKGEKGLATVESKQAAYVFAIKKAAEIAASLYDANLVALAEAKSQLVDPEEEE